MRLDLELRQLRRFRVKTIYLLEVDIELISDAVKYRVSVPTACRDLFTHFSLLLFIATHQHLKPTKQVEAGVANPSSL